VVIHDFDLVRVTFAKLETNLAIFKASNRSMAASKSSPRNWFGRSPSQTLRAAEFRHDLIMARTYYEKR